MLQRLKAWWKSVHVVQFDLADYGDGYAWGPSEFTHKNYPLIATGYAYRKYWWQSTFVLDKSTIEVNK